MAMKLFSLEVYSVQIMITIFSEILIHLLPTQTRDYFW